MIIRRSDASCAVTGCESRILVVRGGAIGDFVLTLPAIGLLRSAFPNARIELLGYPHIASLADGRHYVDRVRSIEYGPLSGFFAKNSALNPELAEYFLSFQQVVSFLFDPDGIFEANVRSCGVRHFLPAFRRPEKIHAAREWAAPLESLALYLEDPAARLFPSDDDRRSAARWLGCGAETEGIGAKRVLRFAIHPGSGSAKKNWPVEKWRVLGSSFFDAYPDAELILVGGEADGDAFQKLQECWPADRFLAARDLPLPLLAAILRECDFFCGHDSGVSHIAAAVGVQSLLLFGPTDPRVWAPANRAVRVIVAPGGCLEHLETSEVQCVLWEWFSECVES
jgi:heptosyltransferase-3